MFFNKYYSFTLFLITPVILLGQNPNLNYNKFAKLSETNTQKINALTNAIGEKYFA